VVHYKFPYDKFEAVAEKTAFGYNKYITFCHMDTIARVHESIG